MSAIQKAPETMTSRQRVRRTLAHEKTDRVCIGYASNPGIHARLCAELGIPGEDRELLCAALGVDERGIEAPYIGKPLFAVPENRRVNQLEGAVMRWVEHETGGYWDFCDFPLKDAAEEAFYSFPVPNPDDFDYDAALQAAKAYGGAMGLHAGGPGMPDVINSNGRLMGMEDVLCHLILGDEAALSLINRRAAWQLGYLERLFEKCKGQLDFLWLGEDLGTQHAPMVSLELYRSTLGPIHRSFVELGSAYGLPAIIHTCGSSSWAYEDMIAMGMTGVDTLQPEAAGMSPRELKAAFGNRLCYRGCISTAGPVITGTPEEVRRYVFETMDVMMPGGGYTFAPTHQLQDNTPAENVVAMYQGAHDYCR